MTLCTLLRGELKRRNPRSHEEIETEVNKSFHRMFVLFQDCVQGLKFGCRPFIVLDGFHLRGKYMSSLLTAKALDGNNGWFPILYVVVKSENLLNWYWFITNLKDAFGGELENIIRISD